MRSAIPILCVLMAFCLPGAARAEVDVRTPWADVYVGPEGVYVHGPWGRVDVPSAERTRVCEAWREKVRKHYKKSKCEVEFDDKGCTIEDVDCDD